MEPALSSHPLHRLLAPRGVAVVGASGTPGKYGYILLKTLLDEGYGGRVYGINPRGGAILDRPFLPSLDEAEGPVDVALVVRPAPECVAAVADVARRGIPFVIVYAAGFAELGEDGRRLEAEMVQAASAAGTRLVGPNGMNIFSAPARLNLSAIVPFPVGALGFLSASGNLGYALAHEAARHGRAGFSRFLSVGNQADLALDEYLDFLRMDPATRVVLVYLEGFVRGRARAFLDVLTRTAAIKPVLVLRGGRTRSGERTARSHTGALAGESRVADAALEQAGAVLVERADEALPLAQAFLESPLPAGPRVALVGEGGGHATLLTDAVTQCGLRVEPFPDALVAATRPHLPPFAAIVTNPVEMGGRSEYDPRIYEKIVGPVVDWTGCDQLVLFGGYALYDEALAEFLAGRRSATGKPILVHDLYADEDRPALAALKFRGLPVFSSADVTARAAGALFRGGRGRARARRALDVPEASAEPVAASPGRLERALPEEEAARLLQSFGVSILPAELARSAEDAVAAAARLGFPVVLKVHTASIVHKTDVGGVHLDLRSTEDVRRAYEAASLLSPEVRLTPYRPGGVEVLAGVRRDPEYGPILLCGRGGVLAELEGDVAIRTLPCPREEIDEMIDETRVGALLSGLRGADAASREALASALAALSRLLLATPAVVDAEVNPLRCDPDGVVALDARVLVS